MNRDRAAAILLFCALCGVLLGFAGRALRLRRLTAPPAPAVAQPVPPVAAPDRRVVSVAPADAGAAAAVADAGTPQAGRALWVVVLDARGQPVTGAQVVGRLELSPSELAATPALLARPPGKTTSPQPIGELGVRSGPLPFPEDIIAGAYQAQGIVQRGSSSAAGLSATTDNQGVARLFPVPPGTVQLLVNHDSKSAAAEVVVPMPTPQAPSDSPATALRIVLRLGAQPDALCTLPADPGEADAVSPTAPGDGPEVTGRVEDGRGFPVSGARLELTSGRVRTQTLSDPRGEFAVRGLPAGALTMQVRHAGFAPLTLITGADKPRHDLRLTLHPGGGIAGLIRDARVGGVPPGAQLVAEADGGGRQPIALAADGRFVATGLPPGELTLRVRAPGYAPLAVPVKVPAGETPEQITLPDLRLELVRGATVRGRISGPDGVAAGATVTVTLLPATGPERPISQLVTDAHGEFVAAELPPGKLRIKAVAGPTTAHAELELTAGDTQHTELELR